MFLQYRPQRVWEFRRKYKYYYEPLDLPGTRINIESTVWEHLIYSRPRKHKVLLQLGCYSDTSSSEPLDL